MPSEYRRGSPYNPGQYPVADFMLGMAADPSNEVPIGPAAKGLMAKVNPEILTAGGRRMYDALKNMAKKSKWAENILGRLESDGLSEEVAREKLQALSQGKLTEQRGRNSIEWMRRGPKDTTDYWDAYGGIGRRGHKDEIWKGAGPDKFEKLASSMSDVPLPETQLSLINGGAGEPKYKTVYETPDYEIRKSTLGFSNGKPFDTGEEKFWTYNKRTGEYESGHSSMQGATNEISGMDTSSWSQTKRARDAEEMFSELRDYYNEPTSKGHYTVNAHMPEELVDPMAGNLSWREMTAVPGGKPPLSVSRPNPMSEVLRSKIKSVPQQPPSDPANFLDRAHILVSEINPNMADSDYLRNTYIQRWLQGEKHNPGLDKMLKQSGNDKTTIFKKMLEEGNIDPEFQRGGPKE